MDLGLGLSQGVLAEGVARQLSPLVSSSLQKMGSSRDLCHWQRLPALGVPWDRTPCIPSSGEALIFSAGLVCLHMGKLRKQQDSLHGAGAPIPLLPPARARGVCV